MSMEILSLDDVWQPAADASHNCAALKNLFARVANTAKESLAADPYDTFGASVDDHSDAGYFVVNYSLQKVRFSFTTSATDGRVIGRVAAHRMPVHECFEYPLPLGDFSVDEQGQTSLTTRGRFVTLNNRDKVIAVLLHFCLMATDSGFASK